MDLVLEGDARCVIHALRGSDVDAILTHPLGMIGSDGLAGVRRGGLTHPRSYAAFPKVLREYVRERKLLALEAAVRKMTSMPARRFGLAGRGLVAEGHKADLVLFDPRTVGERATFENPHRFPRGIRWVIVNGRVAWNGRSISAKRHGQVLRGARGGG
jgi:dihydroorotase/N-acyl-D-amino-acid deacylase